MSKQTEALKLALKRAFNLGQTYWQQADSEYTSQWKKADVTLASFNQLVEDTINVELAEPPAQHERVQPDSECKEDDGCPTEKAVLQRFWRKAQQQEPVAWRELLREARDNCKASIVEEGISASRKEYRIDLEARLTAALNTSPPIEATPLASQRSVKPWVGLTDVEWQEIDASLNGKRDLARIFVRAIEAKLQEKNA